MAKTIDGVDYVLDKPEVSDFSCKGCVAQTSDGVLCDQLMSDECLDSRLVWRKASDETAERDTFEDACVQRFIEWRKMGNVVDFSARSESGVTVLENSTGRLWR